MTSDIAYTPILPEGWTRPRGFSHAVVATGSKSVRIAGQIGREPGQAHIPAGTDAGAQWRVALSNLVTVLKAAGGQPAHLVALRAYVTDIAEFNAAGPAIGAAWSESFHPTTWATASSAASGIPVELYVPRTATPVEWLL